MSRVTLFYTNLMFLSHGKSNSCDDALSFYGTEKVNLMNEKDSVNGSIFLPEAESDVRVFVKSL